MDNQILGHVAIVLIMLLPVISPILFLFLALKRAKQPLLRQYLVTTFIPPACVCLVMWAIWLPSFEGTCGGWLGETSPCHFAQFFKESLFWSFMSLGVPTFTLFLVNSFLAGIVIIWRKRRFPKRTP